MKYFELFAGVGGFGIGIQNAYNLQRQHIRPESKKKEPHERGFGTADEPDKELRGSDGSAPLCVGFSEIDKYASQVLKYKYPNVKNYGDIKKINWSEVPDFDLLTGGSPCQDFSIAGKRAGIEGERSGLVWEYIRCLNEKKPKYFIWENVKGVLSSRRGYDFGNILTAFSESGYSLWWQVLNAKDFGVPQNRERVFVVGFRDGCPPEVFFEPGTNGKDIQNLEPGAGQAGRRYDTKGISPTIPTAGGGRHIPMINPIVAPTIRANHHNTADVHFIEDFFPGRVRKTKNSPAIRKGRQGVKVMIGALRGRNPENPKSRKTGLPTEQMLELNLNGTSNTLTKVEKDNYVVETE